MEIWNSVSSCCGATYQYLFSKVNIAEGSIFGASSITEGFSNSSLTFSLCKKGFLFHFTFKMRFVAVFLEEDDGVCSYTVTIAFVVMFHD